MDLQHWYNQSSGTFSVLVKPGLLLDLEGCNQANGLAGIAPCLAQMQEGQRFLHYDVRGYQPVSGVCRQVLTKHTFLALERKLAQAGLSVQSAGLSLQVTARPETAFVGERDARFCLLPIQGYRGEGIRHLLLEVIFISAFSDQEDCSYVQSVLQCLKETEPFSLTAFLSLLDRLEGKAGSPPPSQKAATVDSPEKGGTVLISNAVALHEQAKAEEEARKAAQAKAEEEARKAAQAKAEEEAQKAAQAKAEEEARKAAQAKAEEEARKAAQAKAEEEARKAAQAKAEEEARKAAQAKAEEEAQKAAQAKAEEEARKAAQEKKTARLLCKRTGETIVLDRPVFRIGKKAEAVDYCIADNPSVSRHHADIVTKDGHCFLIDQNSLNKTYINGKAVQPGREIALQSSDQIYLANELFTFLFD